MPPGIPLPFIRRDAGWAPGSVGEARPGCSQATSAGTSWAATALKGNERRRAPLVDSQLPERRQLERESARAAQSAHGVSVRSKCRAPIA
jgi:hypothetical protein